MSTRTKKTTSVIVVDENGMPLQSFLHPTDNESYIPYGITQAEIFIKGTQPNNYKIKKVIKYETITTKLKYEDV